MHAQERAALPCHSEPALGEMFAAVRSEALLSSRLAAITHQLSDASLAQARHRADVQKRGWCADKLDMAGLMYTRT